MPTERILVLIKSFDKADTYAGFDEAIDWKIRYHTFGKEVCTARNYKYLSFHEILHSVILLRNIEERIE